MRRSGFFFVVVLSLLALFCAYVGLRLIPSDWPAPALVAAWVVVIGCVAAPAAALIMRRTGQASARVFFLALMPVGLFVMVLTFTAARDLLWLVAALVHVLPDDADARIALFHGTSAAVVAAGASLFLFGTARARGKPTIVDVEVPIAGLHASLHGFTIAQISDVHVGRSIKRPFIENVVAAVNSVGADLIAITGDLVDGTVAELGEHTAPLADLKATHGAWFVPGNHDYYAGVLPWIEEVKRLGLRVLLNTHEVIEHEGHKVVVAGVTDHGASGMVSGHQSDPHKAMSGAPVDAFKLLLAHQPASAAEASKAGFQLQLSGHTHGGQFFPGTLFAHLVFPFVAGLHKLDQMWIYTSNGTGYVGPPLRTTRVAGEVTRLVLVPAP